MALIDKLTAIADAIRAKTGKAEEMTLDQMPSEIAGISGGGVPINNQDKTITENGTYTADEGYTGLGTVTVDVASNTLVELTTGDPSKNTPIANIQNLAIYCGNVVRIGEGAFQNAYSLKRAVFPNAEHIDSSAFNSCSSLEVVVAANASRVSDTAFNNCMNLKEFA